MLSYFAKGDGLLFTAAALLFIAASAFIGFAVSSRHKLLHRRIKSLRAITTYVEVAGSDAADADRTAAAAYGVSAEEAAQLFLMMARLGLKRARAAVFTSARLVFVVTSAALATISLSASAQPAAVAGGAVCAAIVAWFFPLALIRREIKRRKRAFGEGFPDALELLAICIEAGLALETAIHRVSHELRSIHPAVAYELAATSAEVRILPDRERALMNLATRVGDPTVRSVVGTLTQTLRYGTPLAQALRTAASEMRAEQIAKLEEQANRLPALLTLPVMLFIMPTIFLIVGGPAVLHILDAMAGQK